MDLLKKLDKDGHISEDEHHKDSARLQEQTDKFIKEIDQVVAVGVKERVVARAPPPGGRGAGERAPRGAGLACLLGPQA